MLSIKKREFRAADLHNAELGEWIISKRWKHERGPLFVTANETKITVVLNDVGLEKNNPTHV